MVYKRNIKIDNFKFYPIEARAAELKRTKNQLENVLIDVKDCESSEVQKLSHQLDRKRRTLEVLLEKMKKQREIQHALQKRLRQS